MTDWTPSDGDLININTTVAHAARVYDYLLGGVINFAVDREAAEQQAAAFDGLDRARASVRGNRDFLAQVIRYLAGEAGVRQFLDIGTGIPTEPNVHQIAQQIEPGCRVVYVDNDPIVLAHAHMLSNGSFEGATDYVPGDLRQPEGVLKQAAQTLDFNKPIAVLLIAVLHLVPDETDPYGLVSQFLEALRSGSYLAISHRASDIHTEEMAALAKSVPASATYRFALRSNTDVYRFFEGLELVEPGVVPIDQWRPAPAREQVTAHHWGGVGRKL